MRKGMTTMVNEAISGGPTMSGTVNVAKVGSPYGATTMLVLSLTHFTTAADGNMVESHLIICIVNMITISMHVIDHW
jgi:hypothetical protein